MKLVQPTEKSWLGLLYSDVDDRFNRKYCTRFQLKSINWILLHQFKVFLNDLGTICNEHLYPVPMKLYIFEYSEKLTNLNHFLFGFTIELSR